MEDEPEVILIVNCTYSKKVLGGAPISLGECEGKGQAKLQNWIKTSVEAQPRVPACHLYRGENWNQVLQAFSVVKSRSPKAQLWVVSAGLGLISSDTTIPEYSATFSMGDLNSVGRTLLENQLWWKNLSNAKKNQGGLGSVVELVQKYPNAVYLMSLSAPYIKAILPDLCGARNSLKDPEKLIVISVGSSKISDLGNSILPLDARFENKLSGTRHTLNNRLLRNIVETHNTSNLRCSELGRILKEEWESLKPITSFNRKRMSDTDLVLQIRSALEACPTASCTRLLRNFRLLNIACESKRFAFLFAGVKQEKTK